MQDPNAPRINWNENLSQPEPEDINLDNLPKVYPQFNETGKQPQTPTPITTNQTVRYTDFDEKAFLGQSGFIEDNEPYDVIDLPSKGYFYPNKKSSLRVGYLTAADENILTSPNLIQSGRMIDVLLRKKIKDRDIEISKLMPGDRTAVMLFLRATGYGKDYPVILTDPITDIDFEYVVDLTTLPVKEISEIPDDNGEFSFLLPRTKKNIKVRLLNPKDDVEIEEIEVKRKEAYGDSFISNMGIQSWFVVSSSRPKMTIDPIEIPFLNTSTWVAGRFKWDAIDVTLRDPIGSSASQAIMEWVRLHAESVTGRMGYAAGYKKNVTLEMLDPTGVVIERWKLVNTMLTSTDFGSLDYSSGDLAEITINLQMDRCILVF